MDEIKEVSLENIVVNPFQPRRLFNLEELEELAASIKAMGLVHPPVVRPREDGLTYEIIAGERRCRAAKLAGLEKIPVVIRGASHSLSAQAALVENVQRSDLNPIEIAKALKSLVAEFGFQQEELAKRIGKKRSTVANYLRLLSLPQNIQESVLSGTITMGHAKAILALDDDKMKNSLHDLIVKKSMTVRMAEKIAGKMVGKTNAPAASYSNHNIYLKHLAEQLQEKLGTKVAIQGDDEKGSIVIDYFTLDDLNRLLESLGACFE